MDGYKGFTSKTDLDQWVDITHPILSWDIPMALAVGEKNRIKYDVLIHIVCGDAQRVFQSGIKQEKVS